MSLRYRVCAGADRVIGLDLVLIPLGSALAFGGLVWWMKPALGVAVATLVLAWIVRVFASGLWPILKSPVGLLGWGVVALGVAQLVPLPARIASVVAPRSSAVHRLGGIPDRILADDPSAQLTEGVALRSPATLDRSGTLRWVFGAVLCLIVFGLSSHYSDRIGRTSVVWGGVVAAFAIGTAFGAVERLGGPSLLYGNIEPGLGRPGTPSLDDLRSAPGETVLRPIGQPDRPAGVYALARAESPASFGTMLGGAGGYLALGALALPLAFGMALQNLAPRGSREGISTRLRDSGKSGQIALLLLVTILGAFLIGQLSGPILAAPFLIGLLLVGLPAARASGLRWTSVALTFVAATALGAGVFAGEVMGEMKSSEPLAKLRNLPSVRSVWIEAAKIGRDFPALGAGLGSYATVAPYYKTREVATTTPLSTLARWWVETGLAGAVIVGVAGLWCLIRLPGAIGKVGTADRTLAFTLVGSALCFGLFSVIHWTIDLPAVALCACVVAGTANRWLAGGTDLFAERV